MAAGTPPVHVRMVHDYEYTLPFKSTIISLRTGDRFCLQEKVTPNWWRVTRLDQTSAELVIPAVYAEEIRLPALPPKPGNPVTAVRGRASDAPAAPPKPPAKPGKKPSETMPDLDESVLAELFEILTANASAGVTPVENRPVKNKSSSPGHGTKPKAIDGKSSKSKHSGSVEDLKRTRRLSSEIFDESSNKGNTSNSLSSDVRQKSKTLGRLGGGGAGTVPNAMVTFGDYWSDNRDILSDTKTTNPVAEWKERHGSVESLDAGFTEDDDSGSSYDGLKQTTEIEVNYVIIKNLIIMCCNHNNKCNNHLIINHSLPWNKLVYYIFQFCYLINLQF